MPDFCLKGGKVLRSIEIPYGRGRQIFHIEDHRLTGVLMPETMPKAGEETEIVRRAISAPIDSARLSTLSQTAERILLITSDHMLIALRDHSCNDEWTGAAGCVCMHAKNPTPPINPRQSIDCETTNSMIAVLKPGDSFILSPGMSTTCMAPFQPFWFDAFSPNQVFHIDRQETAIASWIRREEINRAAIDGRIPVEEYRAEMKEMERAWINRAQTISRSDRQIFVNENALQAECFIDKWLDIAKKNPPQPRGDSAFQMWWKNKNAELGKDRRIAW